MTRRSFKYSKILAIIFLTVLIWVWADLAKTEQFSVSSAVISVAKSTNPNLWVSFNDKPSISVEEIVLKGPASKTDKLKRKLREGSLNLEFFLDPQQEGITEVGERILAVLDFLKRSDQIKQHGLTVQSCQPEQITVNVVRLVEKSLDVSCVDENQNPIKGTTIRPSQVQMLVPEDWQGEKLIAMVQLRRGEINQARLSPIKKTPYIELAAGQIRQAPTAVELTTPPEEDRLGDYTITTATLGFSLSANLQGRYKVEVTNPDIVMSAISVRATADAKRAYDKMRYQVILEIDDSDKDAEPADPLRRELIYNFPAEYVRRDEITLNQPPVVARFRLIALPSAKVQPSPIQ